jgi:hypothetical protein
VQDLTKKLKYRTARQTEDKNLRGYARLVAVTDVPSPDVLELRGVFAEDLRRRRRRIRFCFR